MTSKNSTNKEEGTMSMEDIIHWQDSLKKDIDFDKPDNELSQEELVKKQIYLIMDKMVEEKIGTDVKKDLDEKRKEMESLSKFQTSLNKLVELGREIEKNFVWQGAYLINHFDKSKENHYFVVTRGMTDDAIKKDVPNSERVEFAKKILEIIKVYREKVAKELLVKQEIISALLPALENTFNETDFDLFGVEVGDKSAAEKKYSPMKFQFQEWLSLSKELSKNRKKAIEAVDEDLDIDEIVPKFIVQNNGDVTKNISRVEMKTKGERMVRLVGESVKAEKEIETKRSKISEELFGKAEEYMEMVAKFI